MESQRTLIEAYISARYPASAVCGLGLSLRYLVGLYQYAPRAEALHLVELLTDPTNRDLFERLVLPEAEQLTTLLGDVLPEEPAESLFVHMRTLAKATCSELHAWLNGNSDEETGQIIMGVFEMLHEIMSSVYVDCSLRAFTFWFDPAPTCAVDQYSGSRGADYEAEPIVEAYLQFLAGAENRIDARVAA